jgi:hypothetical protein
MVLLLLAALFTGLAGAQGFATSRLHIGGGLSVNQLDGFDDATGYQLLVGYDLDFSLGAASSSVEAGYMDSGEFDLHLGFPGSVTASLSTEAKGAWVTGNIAYPLNPSFDLLARAGYDGGDDDGLMLGAGLAYGLAEKYTIRAEYVVRDETESLQLNLIYFPGW